ncbi:MAG: lectin [Acidobacteria bacterium]|nr:lectin [Acidobacteriota bacterium]
MRKMQYVVAAITLSLLGSYLLLAQNDRAPMTFFLTSNGPGNGANLGGLAGADRHCQMLAQEAGAGDRTWRAYLSTQGQGAVNARDRIGQGPWHNANGALVGNNVDGLHSYGHRMTPRTSLTEDGRVIPGAGFSPNRHDILTGSQPDGTAFPSGEDMTCQNWTSSDAGKAKIGHHDRGAWNSAHDSRGCSQEALRASGGDGLFYCFAGN